VVLECAGVVLDFGGFGVCWSSAGVTRREKKRSSNKIIKILF
jgi:hypothetical protein